MAMNGKVYLNTENGGEYVVVDDSVWFLDRENRNIKSILFKHNQKCAAPMFVMSVESFKKEFIEVGNRTRIDSASINNVLWNKDSFELSVADRKE